MLQVQPFSRTDGDEVRRRVESGYHVQRVEATTRADNAAMRRALRRAGYAKEAHYRRAWPDGGRVHDAVGYAVLRGDWETGVLTPVDWDDEPA